MNSIVKSKQLFVLIGDDRTGKTTFQKMLIEKICKENYERLPVNTKLDIKHFTLKTAPNLHQLYQFLLFQSFPQVVLLRWEIKMRAR